MNCETALVIITTPDPFPCNPPISLHFSFEISLLNNFHLLRLLCPPPPPLPSVSRHAWTPQFLLIISKLP